MRAHATAVLALAAIALVVPAGAAAYGPLDPTFGEEGRVTLRTSSPSFAAALLPSEQGYVFAGGAGGNHALLRLRWSGAVDPTFGGFPGLAVDPPSALAARVGGGWFAATNLASPRRAVLVAHRPDGSVDRSFGSEGIAPVPEAWRVGAIASLPDGGVLVGGADSTSGGEDARLVVARVTANGTPDPTLNFGRPVTFLPAGGEGLMCEDAHAEFGVRALAPVPGGGALVASTLAGRQGALVAVTRLLSNGSPDPSYGDRGSTILTPRNRWGVAAGMVVHGERATVGMTEGRACAGTIEGLTGFAVARLDARGRPVETYGRSGTARVRFPDATVWARAVAALPNGGLAVVGGRYFVSGDWAVARLTAAGRLARRFGGGRTCTRVAGLGRDGAATAALGEADGRLVVAGAGPRGKGPLAFARYRAEFTPGGVECFAVDSDGGGYFRFAAILGSRGRVCLRAWRGRRAGRGRVRTACFGVRGPSDFSVVWDRRADGQAVPAGIYTVVLESRARGGRLLGRSYPVRVEVLGRG